MELKRLDFLKQLGLVSIVGLAGCSKDETPDKILQFLEYIDEHPEEQEFVINHLLNYREKNSLKYSRDTLGNLSEVLLSEAGEYPYENKDFILEAARIGFSSEYRKDLWDQLSKEEKLELSGDAVKKAFGDFLNEAERVGSDTYRGIKDSGLYENFVEFLKESGESIKSRYGQFKEGLNGDN